MRGAGRRTVRVLTFAEVPRSEAKFVMRLSWHRCYVTLPESLGDSNFRFPNPGRPDIGAVEVNLWRVAKRSINQLMAALVA